jgi:small subunit ribosomal protein S9
MAIKKTVKKEKEQKEESVILQYAVGRRKRSVAKVRMFEGKGEIIVNDKDIKTLVHSEAELKEFLRPLAMTGMAEGYKFTVKVMGGGHSGQLEAIRHGISRCISKVNDDLKVTMRKEGFLTRDPREKERKKVYHIGARKSPQFSKR